jgi:hypothetical protein
LSFGLLFSLYLICFLLVLSGCSQFWGNTELKVIALSLPKIFQNFSCCLCEVKFLAINICLFQFFKTLELCFVQFKARNGDITFIFIGSSVNDLQKIKFFLDHNFDGFPVDLVLIIFCLVFILSCKMNNVRVFEIFDLKNDSSLSILFNWSINFLFNLFFLIYLFSTSFIRCLTFSLFQGPSLSRKGTVANSSDLWTIFVKLDLFWLWTCLFDL